MRREVDAADLIQGAPQNERASLPDSLDPWPKAEVTVLAYQEDEAGGLMNPRFARLRPEMEIDEALAYLRRQAGQVESIYDAYVFDSDQRLLGVRFPERPDRSPARSPRGSGDAAPLPECTRK